MAMNWFLLVMAILLYWAESFSPIRPCYKTPESHDEAVPSAYKTPTLKPPTIRCLEMAFPMVRPTNSTSGAREARRDEIYVAAMSLRASKGPAQMLLSAAYSLNLSWDFQHFMVLIKPTSSPRLQAFVFDFQPKDPENMYVALAALSGKAVPGAVLTREIKKVPRSKCWFVASKEDAVDMAYKFNGRWETDLTVGRHDCRDYTNALVEYLTGERNVLERLRRTGS